MLTFREWVHYYKEIDELEFNWNAIYTKNRNKSFIFDCKVEDSCHQTRHLKEILG